MRDEPPPGVCDIWVAQSEDADRWAAWLPPAEGAAVDRRRPGAGVYLTSRALQRVAIAAYAGVEPHALTIDRTCTRCGDRTHGRPTVRGGPPYSVTRTGSFVALAVVADGTVGIDAECVRPGADLTPLASLLGVAPTDTRTVLTAWVRHEAALKARGTGIGDLWPVPAEAIRGVETVDLALPGVVLAVATSRRVRRVRWTEAAPEGVMTQVRGPVAS
ncbi:4'-phosphopantetheinyl transferase family protein [Cellulosimicrobium cellulans]|uniref:4'-phosphopantetheinyl transferase family protein n=1 Tax=Cellulosimicrobium cellulans TaxID=1710 RepID=UPI0037F3BB3A